MALLVKRNDLLRSKRVKAICVTGFVAKLDLESIIRKNLDDRPDHTGGKPKAGHVGNEGHRVEKLNG